MLRIIAGKYKSRKIKEVKNSETRPTTDKNKETIFNSIGQFFCQGNVLDLYAGSGSLGIEALSRGMTSCDFVDTQSSAIKIIHDNIQQLNIDEDYHVIRKDAISFINQTNKIYDLILVDPPYKLSPYKEILNIIDDRQLLSKNGIIVMESHSKVFIEEINNIKVIKEKKLGQSKITILRRVE